MKDIIENNKLIAEFMGGEVAYGNSLVEFENGLTIGISRLKYHESWDWLMPVVEKIERYGYDTVIRRQEQANLMYVHDTDAGGYGDTKIQAVFNAVVEFIKWIDHQDTEGLFQTLELIRK